MTRNTLIRLGILGAGAAGLTALALVAAQAAAPAPKTMAPAVFSDTDARYAPASQLEASALLNATVFEAENRPAGRIVDISFGANSKAEWVWLRFDGMLSGWTLRAPVSSLYLDRAAGKLRTDRTLEELRRLAAADPEVNARTATAIPARFAPASRLMGLQIVGAQDNRVGYVHAVQADPSGAADALVVERRFGLFHAKTERYVVPAENVSYLPVTQQLMIHSLPQPTLASIADNAG